LSGAAPQYEWHFIHGASAQTHVRQHCYLDSGEVPAEESMAAPHFEQNPAGEIIWGYAIAAQRSHTRTRAIAGPKITAMVKPAVMRSRVVPGSTHTDHSQSGAAAIANILIINNLLLGFGIEASTIFARMP
jgi:hypothetical protein